MTSKPTRQVIRRIALKARKQARSERKAEAMRKKRPGGAAAVR